MTDAPERTPLSERLDALRNAFPDVKAADIESGDLLDEIEAAIIHFVSEVAALEQERAMPCGHAQRLAVHSKDFMGDGPDSIGTSYCGECEKIAALEQERDEWQERDDVRCRLIAEQGAEVERLRAALQWLVNLAHGMGKAGGPPEEGEWDAAWKNAADCLIGALTEGED